MKPTVPAIALFVVALLALIGVAMLPHFAPQRQLRISAPPAVQSDRPVQVEVSAITRLTDGEHVGFLQVETSRDNGATWKAIAYKSGMGRRGDHWFLLDAGDGPQPILIRARAAFRDGEAGDVDQYGQPIDWNGTWDHWDQPPASLSSVAIR